VRLDRAGVCAFRDFTAGSVGGWQLAIGESEMWARLAEHRWWPIVAWAVAWAAVVAAVAVLGWGGLPRGVVAVLAPVLAYAGPLVLALAVGAGPEPGQPGGGDVDHLLAMKRAGGLPRALRPPHRGTGSAGWSAEAEDCQAVGLDRLVLRKRRRHEANEQARDELEVQ
jgi:hypothetical protein